MSSNKKLRETCKAIKKQLWMYLGKEINDSLLLYRIDNIVKNALGEPVLNCEVGTAEEQRYRFLNFCNSHRCSSCPVCHEAIHGCALHWNQLPYEEEKE